MVADLGSGWPVPCAHTVALHVLRRPLSSEPPPTNIPVDAAVDIDFTAFLRSQNWVMVHFKVDF
jgi:hypothetical protein